MLASQTLDLSRLVQRHGASASAAKALHSFLYRRGPCYARKPMLSTHSLLLASLHGGPAVGGNHIGFVPNRRATSINEIEGPTPL